jgi:hypothetical protein
MSYLEQNDNNILEDIKKRKEFAIYSNISEKQDKIIPRFLLKQVIGQQYGLHLHSYQHFVENFMNPNTPNTRLLMQWSTGMGKTIGSLSIALKFINYYNKIQNTGSTVIGSVWILGFTENIFKSDLIKYPEFGFITESELELMNRLIHKRSEYDLDQLNDLRNKINRRLTNREGNGFFKFIGYKALLNRLFITRDKDINLTNLSENEIAKLIIDKKVILNKELMDEMKNSLLICDEIHDVYNSAEKNNWGVALQTILNYDNSIRSIFLSATPFNNSPTELIELINLLTPRNHFPEFKKSDFFTEKEELIESKISELYKILSGRVSFITNTNPEIFPAKGFIGEKIPGISYLKFIRSPISKFHYNTYKKVFSENDKLSSDSQYIIDYALPNPEEKNPWNAEGIYKTGDIRTIFNNTSPQWRQQYKLNYNSELDILSGDILNLEKGNLKEISAKYYKMTNDIINLISKGSGKIFIYHNVIHMSGVLFIGEILKANGFISENANSVDSTRCAICAKPRKEHTKEQLTIGGSSKHYEIINIKDISCKLFKYKDISFLLDPYGFYPSIKKKEIHVIYVKQKDIEPYDILLLKSRSDIKEWKQLLSNYKITNVGQYYYFSALRSKTRKLTKKELVNRLAKMLNKIPELSKNFIFMGGDKSQHKYIPCKYTLVHSDINRKIVDRNIESYNSITNVWGDHLMILVGGKIMKQSINLSAVQNLIIAGRPDNISSMLQIIGRAIRTNSHILLPAENRLVNLYIYTSALPNNELSYEENKYKEKINTYKVIQKLELILHEVAIDKEMNYDIIFQEPSELQKKQKYGLDILPYTISKKRYTLSELNLETFNAYYGNEEIKDIKYWIKRVFIEHSPVWKYNDLFNFLKKIPNKEHDMSLISEDKFILALDSLVIKNDDKYVEPNIQQINNPLEKYIYLSDGNKYGIVHVSDLYMMVPVENEPIIDVEIPFRFNNKKSDIYVDIKSYLLNDMQSNYSNKRDKFIKKWENIDIRNLDFAICDYGTSFHKTFIEEVIKYIFNIWTNPKQTKLPYHIFYIKILYFYDIHKIIIWAHTVSEKIFEKYKSYAIPINEKLLEEKEQKKNVKQSGLINLIKTSINHNNMEWISSGMVNDFNLKVKESLELFDGSIRKKNIKTKINANYLPIGHLVGEVPRFYNPQNDNWMDDISYMEKTNQYTENPIVIGYDEKTKTSINVKFKLRTPIQNIKQYKDARQIEKGSVCSSKSKEYLKSIAKKLNIPESEYTKINIDNLCMKIRSRLIYNELKERLAGSNIKYFYFLHEIKPETALFNSEEY